MVRVTCNGRSLEVPPGETVAGLIERLGLGARWVVVERNGEPVPRGDYPTRRLEEGDVLEVVRPVQGGAVRSHPEPRFRLEAARLYLVTGAGLGRERLAEVLDAGVDVVQLREKEAEAGGILREAIWFRDEAAGRGVPFIVNDRADVAFAGGADGVHLGQDDVPPDAARRILGPRAIIGRSTHAPEQILDAVRDHGRGLVDYIAVGPVHATPTKPGRPAVGYELVRFASRHADLPWFAIGGIDLGNVGRVVEAGARRIVVVRAITEASDPAAAARALRAALP